MNGLKSLRQYVMLVVVALILSACLDPGEAVIYDTLNVLVIEATISNLPEPQLIRLNRAQADPVTGRSGNVPAAKATVDVLVDSVRVITFRETRAGRYQAPAEFVGQPGHAYQLRITLPDGIRYQSTVEVMPPAVPIRAVRAQFNAVSLSPAERLTGSYAAAHDFYVDFTDPVGTKNYYSWTWRDWERQDWCRSCYGDLYYVYDRQGNLLEDCFKQSFTYPYYDYNCRTACWEIIDGRSLRLFDDQFTDGNTVTGWRVAQIPLYSKEHCLVEIRQNALTPTAYAYLRQLEQQTQNTGGLADTPPAVPIGNVRSLANPEALAVGYFTASAVSTQRYWLTRNDASGFAPGLYQSLNDGRDPVNEQSLARDRPPLAVCVPSDSRTPIKPDGWQD